MLKRIVFFLFLMLTVTCQHERRNKENEKNTRERSGRLFSFNLVDEDISVELDIAIPFMKIPVKKTINSAYGLMEFPNININPGALALGGVVIIGAGLVVPFLLKHYARNNQDFRYARILDNAEFSADKVLDATQQLMTNSHQFLGCPLRVVCWTAQKDYADHLSILNQIISNKLLSSMVNSSAVEDAVFSGRQGRSCSRYEPCPLQEHQLASLATNLAFLTNTPES